MRIGTTFSQKQCGYLELDWKDTYKQVIGSGFDIIRLGAYWDEIEPEQGRYDFSALDWQLDKIREKDIEVILTVGMKAPRWPEFHIPAWLMKQLRIRRGADVSQYPLLREHALRFVQAVVKRYAEEPAIAYWQVENEPLDRSGPGHWWINASFLEQEVASIRALDPQGRPVVVSFATYPNRFLRFLAKFFTRHDPIKEGLAVADIAALNIYPIVGHRWWHVKRSYYRTRYTRRQRYLEWLVRRIKDDGRPVWVTELQAEPWEPGQLVYTDETHPQTSQPQMLIPYILEMDALGIRTVLLWGAEYWVYRQKRFSDASWFEVAERVRAELNQQSQDDE